VRPTIIVFRTSECDHTPISEPMPRDEALAVLKALARKGADLSRHDLVDVESGRLVSWVA